MFRSRLGVALGGFLLASASNAADSFLVVSGGGDVYSNAYSNYLQVLATNDFLLSRYKKEDISVLFGAGNSPNNLVELDVTRRVIDPTTGKESTQYLRGVIEGNQRASLANLEGYFSQLKEKGGLKPNENLFVTVGDHGGPGGIMLLWHGDHIYPQEFGNLIRSVLPNNGSKAIFSMSQCYSGAYHRMSVTDMGSVEHRRPRANTTVCGFTAVTAGSTSSGCTAYVDGPLYRGYERYFTEQLIGKNIVTGEKIGEPKKSYKEAFLAAALIDMTLDQPMSTSDKYLDVWSSNRKALQSTKSVAEIEKFFSDFSEQPLNSSNSIYNQEISDFTRKLAKKIQETFPEIQVERKTLSELENLFAQVRLTNPNKLPMSPGSDYQPIDRQQKVLQLIQLYNRLGTHATLEFAKDEEALSTFESFRKCEETAL